MDEKTEVILETRDDLSSFLKTSQYDFTILKFYAEWCKPCKQITPLVDNIIKEKTNEFEAKGLKNKFIFVYVDVDECFDLYAFLKKNKRLNGIPALFLYSKSVYKTNDDDKIYIPQESISGTDEKGIRQLLNFIK